MGSAGFGFLRSNGKTYDVRIYYRVYVYCAKPHLLTIYMREDISDLPN